MESPERQMQTEKQVEPRQVWWLWLVYALLYAVAIPWYWPADFRGPLILGLPLWVVVTLVAVFALSLWTLFAITRYWKIGEEE